MKIDIIPIARLPLTVRIFTIPKIIFYYIKTFFFPKDLSINQLWTVTQITATDFFIPTMKIPNLTLQYARLLRNAKVQETLYEFLTQQYEMARIQEAKDTPTVQLLDEAKVDKRRIRPQRKRIVLLSTVASGFFALFVVFVLEYLERFMARKKYSQS